MKRRQNFKIKYRFRSRNSGIRTATALIKLFLLSNDGELHHETDSLGSAIDGGRQHVPLGDPQLMLDATGVIKTPKRAPKLQGTTLSRPKMFIGK